MTDVCYRGPGHGAPVSFVLLLTVKAGKAPIMPTHNTRRSIAACWAAGLLAALHSTLPYSVYVLYFLQFDQHQCGFLRRGIGELIGGSSPHADAGMWRETWVRLPSREMDFSQSSSGLQ